LGKHVLIAEDEPHLVESLAFILGREGYEVSTALDGEAALQQIWAASPDLVILDVMLPKINGFDILKKIRSSDALKSLRVIILTAKGQRQDRDMAEEIGADLFLTKPFSNKEVVQAVNKLTAG
jgi:DNA-binding response OmpR family regulator